MNDEMALLVAEQLHGFSTRTDGSLTEPIVPIWRWPAWGRGVWAQIRGLVETTVLSPPDHEVLRDTDRSINAGARSVLGNCHPRGEQAERVAAMSDPAADPAHVADLVRKLHEIVAELEDLHPGRKFALDGHLVGSLGEAAAATMFDLKLVTASSAGHDAVSGDGRKVEIKATYGTTGVGIRDTSHVADSLIVLKLPKFPETQTEVIYDGPLKFAREIAGRTQKNGQAAMSLSRLREQNKLVASEDRIPRRQPR